jgi:hypothetical protein
MIINIFNIFFTLQILIFDVVDVEFQCCRDMMEGFVSRRRGRAPDVGYYTQHGSQQGLLECCTSEEGREEAPNV